MDEAKMRAYAEALASGLSYRRAAERVGIGESTGRRWRSDPKFLAILQQAQGGRGAPEHAEEFGQLVERINRRVRVLESKLDELEPHSPEYDATSNQVARAVRTLRDAIAAREAAGRLPAPPKPDDEGQEAASPLFHLVLDVVARGGPAELQELRAMAERLRTTKRPAGDTAPAEEPAPEPQPAPAVRLGTLS